MSFSLTAVGATKVAQAIANTTTISIKHVVAGSGAHADLQAATALDDQRWQGVPATVAAGDEANQVAIHALIPSSVAAFEITELGLLDADGDLIAYGTLDGIHKPAPNGQIGGEVALQFVLDVGAADVVLLTINPAAAATQAWVLGQLPGQATETELGLAELATANEATAGTDSQRVLTPATGKALADYLIEQVINNSPTALDTLKELADALGSDPNFATTVTNTLAQKAALNHTHTKAQVGLSNVPNYSASSSYSSASSTTLATSKAVLDGLATKAAISHTHLLTDEVGAYVFGRVRTNSLTGNFFDHFKHGDIFTGVCPVSIHIGGTTTYFMSQSYLVLPGSWRYLSGTANNYIGHINTSSTNPSYHYAMGLFQRIA